MKIKRNQLGKFILIALLAIASTGFVSLHAFADSNGNGNGGNGQGNGNGNGTTHTDKGKGNNGQDNGNGGNKTTQVPETPYAMILPIAAVGVVYLVLNKKKRKAV